MSELELTLPAEGKRDLTDGRGAARESARAGAAFKRHFFEWSLVLTVVTVALMGAYESIAEKYLPAYSMLSLLHRHGFLKDYSIVYEPSKGIWHPVGWAGSAMMVVMMLYTVRKRVPFLRSFGSMRRWLSMHMFLGILGPLMVTFHTTFKLHGLIATSFWCMIVTMVFGILGRYIYVQIPRGVSGAELGVKDIEKAVEGIDAALGRYLTNAYASNLLAELGVEDKGRIVRALDVEGKRLGLSSNHISNLLSEISGPAAEKPGNSLFALFYMLAADFRNHFRIYGLRKILKERYSLTGRRRDEILFLLKKKAALIKRKDLLSTSQKLLHHWHVLHVPLAIVMFIIMFLHVTVYYIFRAAN